MTEHDIQTAATIELCKRGHMVFRRNTGVFYNIDPRWFNSNQTVNIGEWLRKNARRIKIGQRGQADLQGHRPDGRAWYLEMKQPGKQPTEEQNRFLDTMRQSGAIAGWADSVEKAVEVVENDT